MINCIVVDDEPLARQLIESYIAQVPELHCLGGFQGAVEAFSILQQQQVEVIFIDIEMPGISGVNFIKALKMPPKVVFITAYTEYAVDAFEIDALDYLVKPVTFDRFLKAVQKINPVKHVVAVKPAEEPADIFLKVDKRLVKIALAEIIHIEALGDYLKVHTANQVYITYMTMGKLEALLPASKFIRIHRSTIVNTVYIVFIEGNFVKAANFELAIGATYREALLKKLNQ